MTRYDYLLVDETTGAILAELPFTPSSPYSRMLTGCGSFSGSIPLDHETATEANFRDGLRSVTVIRDDVPDYSAPIVTVDPDLDSRTLNLSMREASWWMQKRTIEVDKHYNADTHAIVRKLWTYVTSKTDSGSINASVPNFTVSSGNSGNTKRLVLAGSARHFMQDAVDKLCEDPDTGLEYRMDYGTGSTRLICQRTLTLGSPLGTTRAALLTELVLNHYGRSLDLDRAATRFHAVGSGFTATKQNTGSVTDGWPLLEAVVDRSDTADHDRLNDFAREGRRKSQPPVKIYDAEFIPDASGLAFGFCNLGDTLTWDTSTPNMLSVSSGSRRVTQIDVTPPSESGPESVGLIFNLPLDELGT